MAADPETGLTWVGAPVEIFRVTDVVYLEQAQFSFERYLSDTLAASQIFGGRFNAPGEFGVLYTAVHAETAWIEVAHRFRRQGIDGLTPEMGMMRLLVRSGSFADVQNQEGCDRWDVTLRSITAESPTDSEREECWELGRSVRVVGDAIMTLSARNGRPNMPLFPGRADGALQIDFIGGRRERPPDELVQQAKESW